MKLHILRTILDWVVCISWSELGPHASRGISNTCIKKLGIAGAFGATMVYPIDLGMNQILSHIS